MVGIGIGTNPKTITAFESFLKQNKLPLVIDADGINMLSKKKSLLKLLPNLNHNHQPKTNGQFIQTLLMETSLLKVKITVSLIRLG